MSKKCGGKCKCKSSTIRIDGKEYEVTCPNCKGFKLTPGDSMLQCAQCGTILAREFKKREMDYARDIPTT